MRGLFGACNVRRAHQCLTPCVAPAGHLYGHNSYFITIVFFWKFSWSNARWVLFHKWMSIGRWWSRPHLESDTHQSSLRQHLHMITVWQLTIIPMCCVEAHIHILTFLFNTNQFKIFKNLKLLSLWPSRILDAEIGWSLGDTWLVFGEVSCNSTVYPEG